MEANTAAESSANDQPTKGKRPRRRWLQYSLRGLLVMMLLSAVGAWWVRTERQKVQRQERALAELAKVGGGSIGVSYDYQYGPDGDYDRNATKPDNHPWLRWLLGDGYVDKPIYLALTGQQLTKQDAQWLLDLPTVEVIQIGAFGESERGALTILGSMPELRQIDWHNSVVWDEEFAALGQLEKLETVGLVGNEMQISRASMREFSRNKEHLYYVVFLNRPTFAPGAFKDIHSLPALETLQMNSATFGDQDFSGLKDSPLEDLDFGGSNITDEALVHFRQPTLTSLNLSGTQITDAGLAELEHLPQLKTLGLATTHVTDAGLVHVARLPALTYLALSNTCITAEGLKNLSRSRTLKSLTLNDAVISKAGLEHLAKLPALESLSLRNAQWPDGALTALGGFSGLKTLRLNDTQVTDADVAVLANLKLEVLSLPETITPACVPDLLRMTRLTRLTLPRNFPPAEFAKVQAGLPGCRISGGVRPVTRRNRGNAPPPPVDDD